MNRSLSLIRYAKTNNGWRRGSVIIGKNGRLKPDYMLLKDEEVYCPNGRYQMVRYEGNKAIYTDLGNDPADVMNRFRAEESKHEVRVKAAEAGLIVPSTNETRKTLRQHADAFLQMHNNLPHRSDDSVSKYTFVTESFCEKCKAKYPDQVTEADVINWHGWMRKDKRYSDRTAADHYTSLRGWLRFCGIDPDNVITKPVHKLLNSYVKKAVTTYEPHIINKLIAASESERMKVCWEFAYKVGCRDSELKMITRHDLHGLGTADPTVHIKERDEYGNIKDKEERIIELELGLASRLQTWLKHTKNTLLFGTENDKPDGHLLRTLKRTAKRAGLNCGHCVGCKKRGECREFTLHRFRRTYTSRMLVATRGDLTAVMKRTGHSDLDSVMRYLAPTANVREALAKAF